MSPLVDPRTQGSAFGATFFPLLPVTFLAAVAAYELRPMHVAVRLTKMLRRVDGTWKMAGGKNP